MKKKTAHQLWREGNLTKEALIENGIIVPKKKFEPSDDPCSCDQNYECCSKCKIRNENKEKMPSADKLRTEFLIESGMRWINSQGEPDIDYVAWLESKLTASHREPTKNSKLEERRKQIPQETKDFVAGEFERMDREPIEGMPTDEEVFKWLKDQKFQTDFGEQEYIMYYGVDMPKIVRRFLATYLKPLRERVKELEAIKNPFEWVREKYGDSIKTAEMDGEIAQALLEYGYYIEALKQK